MKIYKTKRNSSRDLITGNKRQKTNLLILNRNCTQVAEYKSIFTDFEAFENMDKHFQ